MIRVLNWFCIKNVRKPVLYLMYVFYFYQRKLITWLTFHEVWNSNTESFRKLLILNRWTFIVGQGYMIMVPIFTRIFMNMICFHPRTMLMLSALIMWFEGVRNPVMLQKVVKNWVKVVKAEWKDIIVFFIEKTLRLVFRRNSAQSRSW